MYYGMGDNCYGRGDYYRGDYYRGDIFKDIGKAFKGVTRFVGGALNVIENPIGAAVGIATQLAKHPAAQAKPQGTALAPVPTPLQLAPPSITGSAGGIAGQYGLINIQDVQAKSGGTMLVPGPGGTLVPCQIKGTHLNKASYWTKHGYVPKHSVCVRNRRMNVANGRALRRALRRVTGFGRIVKRMKKSVSRANSAVGNVHRARARKHA